MSFVLLHYIQRQNDWSARVFPNKTVHSITSHIRKEIKQELQPHPQDLIEWIDVVILAFDGAYTDGFTPQQIVRALEDWLVAPFPYVSLDVLFKRIEREIQAINGRRSDIWSWTLIAAYAFQGAFQMGFSSEQIIFALQQKQSINFARKWQTPQNPNDP